MIFPKDEVVEKSYVRDYEKLYAQVKEHPEAFWENIAAELLWFKPWNKVLEWNYPYARWFTGGQTNIVYNALDRHQKTEVKNKLALIWVGQDMSERKFTYGELNEQVCKFANVLKSLGVKKADRVAIYLPKIPEQIIAMLAAAKIGAIHSVVYSGFSSEALKTRVEDAQAKILVTCDGYQYKDKVVETKKNADEAIKEIKTIEHVIVVNRINKSEARNPKPETNSNLENSKIVSNIRNSSFELQVPMMNGRDLWWDELMAKADTICSTAIMDANDPLFILYTSGSTGKPKGVLHGHGGYMVGIYITMKWVFNLNIKNEEIYFCTADPGWITGHSYMVYSPLINGVTSLIYESVPDYPHPGRWWELIDKYNVSIFYTTPTAVRAQMRLGDEIPAKYSFKSLRMLGSVGEPINPKAWLWLYQTIGRDNFPPLLDTWWQTETGMQMITPLPSVPLKPGSAFKPFFGIIADVVDENGNSLRPATGVPSQGSQQRAEFFQPAAGSSTGGKDEEQAQSPQSKQGYLVIRSPWPAMLLDLWKNPERYKETYFENEAIEKKNQTLEAGGLKMGIEAGQENGSKKIDKIPSSTDQLPISLLNPTSNFQDFIYFTGDSAKIDNDGYFWITGRNDDVIKVSGHRLGSAELEHVLVEHPAVAEAAVIGKPHEIKGESIKAFVILKVGQTPSDELKKELVALVRKSIGPIATPDEIDFVDKLPKTRSGKIMRRVLKAQELGLPTGDTSTLEN